MAAAGKTRTGPIARFPTKGKPVRVYAPTASSAYFMVMWDTAGTAPTRKRTSVGKVEADALAFAEDLAAKLCAIQQTPEAGRKFARLDEVVTAYCDPANHKNAWKQGRTAEKAAELARRFITAEFAAREVHTLRPEDFQSVLDDARRLDPTDERPLKRAYLQDARAFLVALGRFAERRHYLDVGQLTHEYTLPEVLEDLVESIDASLVHSEEDEDLDGFRVWKHQLPTWDDIRRIADEMASPRMRLLVLLAASSGLRFGELAALRWSDVKLSNRTIMVRRKVAETNRGVQFVELPKNRKRRDACYPAWLAADMVEAVEQARTEEWFALEADPDLDLVQSGLLFPAPKGGWLRRSNFHPRTWRKAWAAAEWRDGWTFHTLRHCAAVNLIFELDVDLIDVSEMLGHANVGVTQRIYCQARVGSLGRVAAATADPAAPWEARK